MERDRLLLTILEVEADRRVRLLGEQLVELGGDTVGLEVAEDEVRVHRAVGPDLLAELAGLRGQLADALREVAGIEVAFVFGSLATGHGKAGSDVDLLVEFEAESNPGYPELFRMRDAFEALFGRKVDLVEDGFDPSKVKDPLYFRNPTKKAWTKISKASFEKICDGGFRL